MGPYENQFCSDVYHGTPGVLLVYSTRVVPYHWYGTYVVHVYVRTLYSVHSVQCTYTVYGHVCACVHVRTYTCTSYVRTYVPMVRSVLPSGTTGTMVSAARLRRSLCGRVLDWLT